MGKFTNKVAVVTGGAASICANITRRLHADGATVIVAARSVDKGQAIAEALGERCVFIATDIRQDADLQHLVDTTVARFGNIDLLVNNAC